jgi:hypothetical protein
MRVRRTGPQKAAVAKLESFKPTVTWMNGDVLLLSFSASPVQPGDDDLEPLEALTDLRYLHLDGAGVTDAGMVHLGNLRKLEHLSLFRTRLTDAGLVHLHGLENLKRVNLVFTGVTDQGVADLRRAVPGVVVDH